MARWAAIDKEDVHLATIRIYQNAVNSSGRSPRIFLFLPPDPNDATPRAAELPSFPPDAAYIPAGENGVHVDRYELDMVNEAVENQLVVAERPKDPVPPPAGTAAAHTYNPRARTTILTGRIKHECNLRPLFNESYRRQMRERSRAYNTPRRQIRMIEEAGLSGGRGGINRLSSGVATGSFADMIVSVQFHCIANQLTILIRKPNQNLSKVPLNAWPVCRGINCWICCFNFSASNRVGVLSLCGNGPSSPRFI